MAYTVEWIGTVALGVLTEGGRSLTFTLAEGQTVPEEFKVGDELEIEIHSAHPAMIAMDMNSGHYDITHVRSGKVLRILHSTTDYMFKE
jgi:hypothetical protein